MSIKKINIIVEDDSIRAAARGYRINKRRFDAQAIDRIVKRGLPLKIGKDPWKEIAAAVKGTYKNSVDFVEEVLQRTFDKSIQLPDFKVFAPVSTDNTEKLFYKIMVPSIAIGDGDRTIPQFGIDREFAALLNSYKTKKVGALSQRAEVESLARKFKKDLISRGFEEELFGNRMEQRLFHSTSREESLYSPFYNSKYPNILTFSDFQDHFKKDKRFNFLVQVLKTRNVAKYKQKQFDEYLSQAYTSFFVVAGIGVGAPATLPLSRVVVIEMGIFLAEEAIRGVILDDGGSLIEYLIDEYRTINRRVTRHALEASKTAESLKKCIETGKPAAPFKDCGALIDHTNEQVKLIEQAMQDHFSSIFKEMETASEGFKKNRITSEIKEKIINLSLESPLYIKKKTEDDPLWKEDTLDRISKIQKLSKNLNQGHLQNVAQRIQTTKKESASEKWVSDFKELLKMAGEGLSTIYNVKEGNNTISENLNDKQKEIIENARIELSKYLDRGSKYIKDLALRAAWAEFYYKHDRILVKDRMSGQKIAVKNAMFQIVNKSNRPKFRRMNNRIHRFMWDKVIDEIYIDDINHTGLSLRAEKGKLTPARVFIKFKGVNKIYIHHVPAPPEEVKRNRAYWALETYFRKVYSTRLKGLTPRQVIGVLTANKKDITEIGLDVNWQAWARSFAKSARTFKAQYNEVNKHYNKYFNQYETEDLDNLRYYTRKISELDKELSKITKVGNMERLASLLHMGEILGNADSPSKQGVWPNSLPPWQSINESYSLSRADIAKMINEVSLSMKKENILLTEDDVFPGDGEDMLDSESSFFDSDDDGSKGGEKGGDGTGSDTTSTTTTNDPKAKASSAPKKTKIDKETKPEKKKEPSQGKKKPVEKKPEKKKTVVKKPGTEPKKKPVARPKPKPKPKQVANALPGHIVTSMSEPQVVYTMVNGKFTKYTTLTISYKDEQNQSVTKQLTFKGKRKDLKEKLKDKREKINSGDESIKISDLDPLLRINKSKQIVGNDEFTEFAR